jgi:phage-related baseplate assembly protein
VMESDKEFRRRIQLSLEGLSVAGPEGAYLYWSLSADADVLDASATSPTPGNVLISVLSRSGAGVATPALLNKVKAILNSDSIRPLTDLVTVQSASIVNFDVTATIYTYPGPDSSVVLTSARAALDAYLASVRGVGRNVSLSGLYAALHQPGVQRVELIAPVVDISISGTQAGNCVTKTLTLAGTDE